ncbi:MAG: hypothetical protein AAF411_22255, partial [Myxococcota bacterium]
GLITFLVAGLISNSRLADAEDTCVSPSGCDVGELDDVDRASLIADIGLGVAIAGTAVGVIWLLVGGGDEEEASAAVELQPLAGRQTVGARLSGSF